MLGIAITGTGAAELDGATADALRQADGSREAGVGGVTWAARPDGGLDLVRLVAFPLHTNASAQCVPT
jgi:hypothetical protein